MRFSKNNKNYMKLKELEKNPQNIVQCSDLLITASLNIPFNETISPMLTAGSGLLNSTHKICEKLSDSLTEENISMNSLVKGLATGVLAYASILPLAITPSLLAGSSLANNLSNFFNENSQIGQNTDNDSKTVKNSLIEETYNPQSLVWFGRK